MPLQSFDSDHEMTASQQATGDAAVENAIVQTLAYADVFDYPLTVKELHQYLIGIAATPETVRITLNNGRLVPDFLTPVQGFLILAGREPIVETRLRRAEVAAQMWPRARRYGLKIAGLPFVRMVAVTGALTMDNVEPGDDFDYLIVTTPGRLWLCRAIIIAMIVKRAARRGDVICPNYLLSERALTIQERNLFTAHELAQMVPIAGLAVYRRLRQLNTWTSEFLPNAGDRLQRTARGSAARGSVGYLAETILQTPLGSGLERWEMARKMRKLRRRSRDQSETAFSADWCKGHFDSHGQNILAEFKKRLEKVKG